MKSFFKIRSSLALVLLVSGVFVSCSSNSLALTSSPVRLEFSGNPGQTFEGTFELYNEIRQARSYKIHFANFESKDESGQPQFTESAGRLASWMKVESDVVELKPLERKKILFMVEIPTGVEPGGYFAGVLADTINKTGELEQGQVALQGSVGTLILLQVNGQFEEGADILDFQTNNDVYGFRSLPIDFSYRFQNEGQSWVKPLGDIVITDIFGGTSKIVPANPDGNNVLPRSIRKFQASWFTRKGEVEDSKADRPPPLPTGFWNRVQYQARYFALGRYKANLTLTYGQEHKQSHASFAFWIIPWELIITVLGSLILFLGTLTIIATWIALKIIKRRTPQIK